MLTKIALSLTPLLLAGAAIAQQPSAPARADATAAQSTAQYPPCSATVKDKCSEITKAAKAPAHRARRAAPTKIVQRDKVHRRKG